MKPEQIIGAIVFMTGKRIEVIAKEHGRSKANFYKVINGDVENSPVRGIISDIIGRPINEIWPHNSKEQ